MENKNQQASSQNNRLEWGNHNPRLTKENFIDYYRGEIDENEQQIDAKTQSVNIVANLLSS